MLSLAKAMGLPSIRVCEHEPWCGGAVLGRGDIGRSALSIGAQGSDRRAAPLLLRLLVLPLALIALGSWQIARSERVQHRLDVDRAQLARSLDELRTLAETTPFATVQFADGRYVSALVAVDELEDEAWRADLLGRIAAVRHPMAFATVAGGALALASGLVGLLLTEIAAGRARRSREQLVRSFNRLWRILPVPLCAVVLGLSAGLMGASLFETVSIPFWVGLTGSALKLALAGIVIALVALYCAASAVWGLRSVFALATPEPFPERAREVTTRQAPDLWRFVSDLAVRMDASPPDTILVGLAGGFYVTENPVRIHPEDRLFAGRTLYLPAPLLELLDESEIAAILAHELAHFVGEDTRFSVRFVPIHHGLRRSLVALSGSGLNGDPISGVGLRLARHADARFDAAVGYWRRTREFEADRRSCALVGAGANGSALVRSLIADAPMRFVLDGVFERGLDFGPDLVAASARLAAEQGLPDPSAHLEDRQPHPTDSHPPTIQRLQALDLDLDEALMQRATRLHDPTRPSFGRCFVPDWDGLCRRLSADVVGDAVELRNAYREQLEATATSVPEEALALFDNTGPMRITMLVLGTLFGLLAALFIGVPAVVGVAGEKTAGLLVGAILGTAALPALAASLVLNRRKARALIVLTPETLRSSALNEPIRWQDIAGHQILVGYRFTLRLFMEEGVVLPTRSGFSLFTRIRPGKRVVDLDAYGIRGMRPNAVSELIGRYLAADHARRVLATAELDDPVPGVPQERVAEGAA